MPNDPHDVIEYSTAAEFLAHFSASRFRTTDEYRAQCYGLNGHIFRGQANADWPLLPSAWRGEEPLLDYSPQTPGPKPAEAADRVGYLGWQRHAELRAVFLFLEHADRLGLSTPLDYGNVREFTHMINAMMNNKWADTPDPFPSPRVLNELAIAQHNGVPTRLLDWTESPLVAAFFAAYEVASVVPEDKRTKSDRIAVFVLASMPLVRKDPLLVVAPRHGNTFLRVQQGLFTHDPFANNFFCREGRWPTLEETLDREHLGSLVIERVELPSSEADEVLRILYDRGVTRHALVPTLRNAALATSYTQDLFRDR